MRIPITFALLLLAGCRFGTVNQGQVIDYQRATGEVTLLADSNYRDPAHPRCDVLPPISIKVPANPEEMGPEPVPGKLLRLDESAHTLQIFNTDTQKVETVPYQDAAPGADKTVTISAGHKTMQVKVADKYLSLPPDTWRTGDMVRYYYKDANQALRLMNVTKTKLE